MLLTIYYRKGCIKSRFLRAVLRVMDWDLREADADDIQTVRELVQFKETFGSGASAITPAIYTPEAYSHELYCILEYLNERSPVSMYPDQPSMRLAARTIIHRVLRSLSTVWPEYRESGNPAPLLAYYDEIEPLIEDVIRSAGAYRSQPDTPTIIELLFFALLVEVNKLRPLEGKSIILGWYRPLVCREEFSELIAEAHSI